LRQQWYKKYSICPRDIKSEVNLATETAIIEGNPDLAQIKKLIEERAIA
jgi:hypothetical protein